MKVALVHDWLIHMSGGEKVLEALAELFPEAVIYTLFYNRPALSPSLQRMKIKASFLQPLPWIRRYYRWLLPVFPAVIRSFKIEAVDLVISSSHCVAKGIRIPAGAAHIAYCHTPMRYLWGFERDYFKNFPFWLRPLIKMVRDRLRRWDMETNCGVHQFIANSQNVRGRIREFYSRESEVIYPPADVSFFEPANGTQLKTGDYYLVVSAFVPYKRVDLVIEAFNAMDRKLIIVGSGPLDTAYRKLRKNSQISFLGSVSGPELRALYQKARALIFPTEEDFGIVPVEAQASGTPVIAFAKGGALESVKAGLFFQEQTAEAVRKAVLEFEAREFDRAKIPPLVRGFDRSCFKERIRNFVNQSFSQGAAHAR